jgi:electron transfer flavoprotein beta subunit
MKILVPVKHVARLSEHGAAGAHGAPGAHGASNSAVALAPDELAWAPNEWDAFSLETALALRDEAVEEGAGDSEVILVTVGDERDEASLRAGLAMGADRAIRVWDGALDGFRDRADPLSVALVLAKLAAAESPDLVLCGAQSTDIANAATGVALAGMLGLAHLAFVSAVELDGGQLAVQRELEGGAVELLRISLPALLTVQGAANAPRRPNLRAIKQARAQPVSVLALGDIGLDREAVRAAAGARVLALHPRPPSAGATLLEGSPAEVAARIATIVEEATGR